MDLNQTLQSLRGKYQNASLDIQDCATSPIEQFQRWMKESIECQCDEPNAFTLSTVWQGKPRGRIVLLKGIENQQFIFYTNYQSAKGIELTQNSHVALTFLWLPLHRQVRIQGLVTKVDATVSDAYFKLRPRGSQLGAIASPQSQRVTSRAELENLFEQTEKKFPGDSSINRPAHWGGYSVIPDYFEFWQGRDNRMHDRISYSLSSGKWQLDRLAP